MHHLETFLYLSKKLKEKICTTWQKRKFCPTWGNSKKNLKFARKNWEKLSFNSKSCARELIIETLKNLLWERRGGGDRNISIKFVEKISERWINFEQCATRENWNLSPEMKLVKIFLKLFKSHQPTTMKSFFLPHCHRNDREKLRMVYSGCTNNWHQFQIVSTIHFHFITRSKGLAVSFAMLFVLLVRVYRKYKVFCKNLLISSSTNKNNISTNIFVAQTNPWVRISHFTE